MKTKYYWFSFSLNGRNQGVCCTEATDADSGLLKITEMNLVPKADHIRGFELDEKELELDRLYTKEELKSIGYQGKK